MNNITHYNNIDDDFNLNDHYDIKNHYLEWNITSILNYIKNHFFKFVLLIVVALIVFIIEYITNINMQIYSMPSSVIGVKSENPKIVSKNMNNKKKNNNKNKNT